MSSALEQNWSLVANTEDAYIYIKKVMYIYKKKQDGAIFRSEIIRNNFWLWRVAEAKRALAKREISKVDIPRVEIFAWDLISPGFLKKNVKKMFREDLFLQIS